MLGVLIVRALGLCLGLFALCLKDFTSVLFCLVRSVRICEPVVSLEVARCKWNFTELVRVAL